MAVLEDTRRDIQYGVRVLARSPGFAAVAIVSLALGIGANTAVFSVIDALVWRDLPITRPAELVVAVRNYLGRGTADFVTYPAFERIRDAGIFTAVTASMTVERSGVRVTSTRSDGNDTAVVGLVSGSYFATLGVGTAIGRPLTPDDERGTNPGAVAVISDPYWRRQLGATPDVLTRSLSFNGTTSSIVGVANTKFTGEDIQQQTDIWIPIVRQADVMPERPGLLTSDGSNWVRMLARLRPGQSMIAAETSTRTVFAQLPRSGSQPGTIRLDLAPAGRGFAAGRQFLEVPLQTLGAVVGLVLLMACANVAMLMLVRATWRRREIALRLALGAGRWRLVRQLLIESLLIATAAGVAGFLVAIWLTRVLVALAASGRMAFGITVGPDLRMLAAAGAFSVATGLVFGLMPAWLATRPSLTALLTGASSAVRGQFGLIRAGHALVVVQVAVSLVLIVGAGMFARTLWNLETEPVGFDREHVWMFWMAPGPSGQQRELLAPVFAAASERIAALPGVISVSPTDNAVLSGFVGLRGVTAEGHVPAPDEDVNAQWTLVAPKFFETIGMRLLAGRDIGPGDTETSSRVAVVNQAMARQFFGDGNPIGRRFAFGRDVNQLIEVVGLVEDAKYLSARDANVKMVFLPYRQDIAHLFRMCVVVRTATDAPAVVSRIRDELRQIAPAVPVTSVNTTGDQFDRTLSDERLTARLSSLFGVLAVALACVGLYGVMAYSVERRRREIGIRMALGESGARVARRVMWQCLTLVGIGAGLGLPAAVLGARAVRSLLYGVKATDPVLPAAAAGLLAAVAVVASLVPARRASRVDPIVALRSE